MDRKKRLGIPELTTVTEHYIETNLIVMFEPLKTVTMKVHVFSDVTLFSLVYIYRLSSKTSVNI
jgi:hypothetical protein